MTEKLQGNYNGKHDSGCMGSQKMQDEKYNWKWRSTVTHPCGISDVYNVSYVPSETSTVQNSELFTRRTSDTCDALLRPANNALSGVRDCSVKYDAGFQEKMTSSLLSQAVT
jgi:hypothetical protein